MRKASFALLAMVSITIPSLSQNATPESECIDAFKRIDTNSDGVLTHTEIPKARDMPAGFAKAYLVGHREFMAACVKVAQAKQAEIEAKKQAEIEAKKQAEKEAEKQAATSPPAETPKDQTAPAK